MDPLWGLCTLPHIQGTSNFDSVQIVEAIQELLVWVEMVKVSFSLHRAFVRM